MAKQMLYAVGSVKVRHRSRQLDSVAHWVTLLSEIKADRTDLFRLFEDPLLGTDFF